MKKMNLLLQISFFSFSRWFEIDVSTKNILNFEGNKKKF